MILQGAAVVGLKILSKKDNSEIGEVKDIVYDPQKNTISGFLVSFGDVLAEAKVLPFQEIEEITGKNIFAKSSDSIKPSSQAIKPMTNEENEDTLMKGTSVESTEGKQLGNLRDIFFDTTSGKVREFQLTQGVYHTITVPVKKVVTSEEGKTVVKEKNQQSFIDKVAGFFGYKKD